MRFRLHELNLQLNYKEEHIIAAASLKLGCNKNDLKNFTIIRRSIDARKKPVFNFTVEFDISNKVKIKHPHLLKKSLSLKMELLGINKKSAMPHKPIVIGAGPAGLMAALILAENGYKPILFERGGSVESRTGTVKDFWQKGSLDGNNNALYGEGGAGLFSDGKLTSRSKDRPAIKFFMETLIKCGASESLLYDAEPHVGSDKLQEIVPKLRQMIIEKGGEVNFNSTVEKIIIENGEVKGVQVNGNKVITDTCILATGHSARDVYYLLAESGVALQPKPFAAGVRLELPQSIVDKTQWGKFAGHPRLGAAAFRMARKPERQYKACYTFCMCPGGIVIPCASAPGMFTTNGMSMAARSIPFANAAFLVPVVPEDYKNQPNAKYPEIAGCEFQAEIEKAVFKAGGKDYSIPVSSLTDFLEKRKKVTASRQLSFARTKKSNIHEILPEFISDTLVHSIPKMVQIFKNLNFDDVTVYGAEVRSSSPVRIKREEDGQSTNTKGLFPCGEGAGYSGGIVSSALDGLKIAQKVMAK